MEETAEVEPDCTRSNINTKKRAARRKRSRANASEGSGDVDLNYHLNMVIEGFDSEVREQIFLNQYLIAHDESKERSRNVIHQ